MNNYCVTFTAQCRAELTRHPFEDIPGEYELTGENLFSMVSSGSERGGFTQKFPLESYPMETGSSSIARVLKVGDKVTRYKPGDLIYHNGHHTRYVKVNEEDVIPVPEGECPEKILFGRYAAVSMTSIYKMRAKPADRVIVTGQGMVGAMCAAVLQAFGYRVYAVDTDKDRRKASRLAGIKRVGATLDETGVEERSCAALLECSGNELALKEALPYLMYGADVCQVGVPWKACSDWSARDLLYAVFYGYLHVHGGWEWSIPRKNDEFHSHSSFSHIQTAMEMIAEGKIVIPDIWYELRSPWECADVYREIAMPRMRPTTMIFDWGQFKE
ncbi:MAG: hypothetical protein LUH58_00355 [Lachnospiraceae bacterium]|nr:hypothetical protein [Lachnospiraceae bacterium]